jgi:uncharacterized protein (TIGR01777 family)
MGIDYSSVLPEARDEVFAWHTRPGAFARLAPPWQPVRPAREATSLRDGRAVLALPGGLRWWTAAHRPDGYDPPRQFVDELVSLPLAAVLPWRHTHRFAAVDATHTRVTDEVRTPVPAALLRTMFGYRHRQLADDLAAHRRYRTAPLTVALTGGGGLVGSALSALLTTGGHRVIRLVRGTPRTADERRWDTGNPDPELLRGVAAVVHLAGASIAGRFTEAHRRTVRDSRVGPTRRLAELAADTTDGPRVFVSASAIGYYGPDRGDATLTEESERGDGFLAEVVADWEAATLPAAQAGLRVVRVRTGMVLTPRGGVLGLQYPLFLAGLGGRLGSGRQWLSWIGIDDLTDIYLRALVDPLLAGPVNAVAPHPVRNADYTDILAGVLRRPSLLPVPALGPRLLLGADGARELALADQRVRPERLISTGHHFRYPRLEPALRHLLGAAGAPPRPS